MLDIALIFLYYNWNIFSTVFSSVWVILSKNFQIVSDLFGWISRWTLLVCKLQEYVTFAFVWAELTEVTSREKKWILRSRWRQIYQRMREIPDLRFMNFLLTYARKIWSVGGPKVIGPRERSEIKVWLRYPHR